MAPHSSTLAWKIPWTEEPGRLQSMGSLRVGHDWATSLSLFTFMHWRRKWQPTLVFLPGESQGQGSLVGCRLWGRKESDTTEQLNWTELKGRGIWPQPSFRLQSICTFSFRESLDVNLSRDYCKDFLFECKTMYCWLVLWEYICVQSICTSDKLY